MDVHLLFCRQVWTVEDFGWREQRAALEGCLSGHRSRAVLMKNHGPFTIGKDAHDAVKAAVMVEDVARTVLITRQLGEPEPISSEAIDALYDRYQNVYGQNPTGSLS